MKRNQALMIMVAMISIVSCKSEFFPKPKGYNKIEIASPEYTALPDSLPYKFEYSKLAQVLKDTSWISERFWLDLFYEDLGATVQVTYKPINNNEKILKELLSDSYKLTSKHNVKAYAIEEAVLPIQNGDFATIMELSGEVPSQFQFHTTDSANHFLRGALYFKSSTQNDSLAPVINYIKQDMLHLLNTLQWKE